MAYHSHFNFCKRVIETLWITPDSDLEIDGVSFEDQLSDCISNLTSTIEVADTLDSKARNFLENKLAVPGHWDLTDLKFFSEQSARAVEFYSNICTIVEQIRNFKKKEVDIKVDEEFHRIVSEAPSCSIDELEGLDDLVVNGDGEVPEGFIRV